MLPNDAANASLTFTLPHLIWRATARARERDIREKLVRERGRIDAHLRHVAVRFGAGEKSAFTLLDEDVKNSVVERRVRGMAVRFPTPIREIELDRATNWIAAVEANRCIGKIGTGFAVPGAELDDLDFVSSDGSKAATEIAGEPTRL